jgi:hypothetical protein
MSEYKSEQPRQEWMGVVILIDIVGFLNLEV